MIGRMVRRLALLVVLLCVGTVAAQAIVVGYLAASGGLEAARWRQAAAAIQGRTLPGADEGKVDDKPPAASAPDAAEIDAVRSVRLRDLELREESMRLALDQMKFERNQLTGERGQVETIKRSFEAQLAQAAAESSSASEENVRQLWESMKPKQVKEQILLMLDDDMIEQVVSRLAAMPLAKQGRIAGEFKTDEELQKLAEILRQMGEGAPLTEIIEDTRQQMGPPIDATR